MDALTFLYDYLEEPERAAAVVRQRRPVAAGVLGALAGACAAFVAEAAAGRLSLLPFALPSLALAALWQLALLAALAAALHLVLELGGARGRVDALFVHLGLSELPWLAAVPAVLVLQAARPGAAWPARLLFVAVGLWSLALKARGIRHEYGVGATRAWLTLAVPGLAALLLALATTALLAAAFAWKALSA